MSNSLDETVLRVQLSNCRLHLETTGTSLRAVYGDLRYFQAAFKEVAAEVKRLSLDNELMLTLLGFTDWDEDVEECDTAETPKPPTTPTTPCTPWNTPKEEHSHNPGPNSNDKTITAGVVTGKPRRNSV